MTMDYDKARELMVEQQVRPWDVLDARVLDGDERPGAGVGPRANVGPRARPRRLRLLRRRGRIGLRHGSRLVRPLADRAGRRRIRFLPAARRAGEDEQSASCGENCPFHTGSLVLVSGSSSATENA